MSEPKMVDTKPVLLDLEPGTYHWCLCGNSGRHPFCDGAHRGTGLAPKAFTLEAAQKVALCACKQSANPPFCDGAHKKL